MKRTLAKWLVAGVVVGFGLLGFAAAAEAATGAGSLVTLGDITS